MTRRRYGVGRAPIAAATACAAVLALSGCSGDTDPGTADDKDRSLADCQSATPGGGFEYTDARDKTISLDTVPTTVVAQSSVAAGLWDAGYQVAGVYGELGDDAGSTYQRGNVDLGKVEKIGSTYGEFDVDAYAKLQPDLLVDYSFGGVLWYVPSKQEKQIEKLAPTVGVNGQPKDIDEAIGEFTDLAAKLGVDIECNEEIAAAKKTYEEGLAKVGENAGDLKVLIASAAEDSLYVVNPTDLPETQTFEQAGLDLLAAPEPDTGNVFTQLSWEKAGEFADADVILLDGRNTDAAKEKLKTIDTWANLPAVKAGQVYTWYAGAPYSYQSYTKILDELAGQLADSEDLG